MLTGEGKETEQAFNILSQPPYDLVTKTLDCKTYFCGKEDSIPSRNLHIISCTLLYVVDMTVVDVLVPNLCVNLS